MRIAVSSLCDEAPPQPECAGRPWTGQAMKPKFFGLLHLEQDENSAVNVATSGFAEQTAIYVNNAVTLSSSLKKRGIEFELLTNRRDLVEGALPHGRFLRITEIAFETPVPRGIRFYSAHFKVDALRYLSRMEDRYLVLSDLDVICINDYPEAFRNIIKAGIPLCYDISDQEIPSYGHDSILGDLRSVHGIEGEGRWLGGEFIGGTSDFFRGLVAKIDLIFPTYVSNLPRMRHTSATRPWCLPLSSCCDGKACTSPTRVRSVSSPGIGTGTCGIPSSRSITTSAAFSFCICPRTRNSCRTLRCTHRPRRPTSRTCTSGTGGPCFKPRRECRAARCAG